MTILQALAILELRGTGIRAKPLGRVLLERGACGQGGAGAIAQFMSRMMDATVSPQ